MALEIVAGGDVEMRAVADNLQLLREAWERADELAVIQDELSYPPGLLSRLRQLKS